MRLLLAKMLFRNVGGGLANVPVLGVLVLLSLGVGLFWSVQMLLSNYLGGLTRSVLDAKEEIAIYKNPLYKRRSAADGGEDCDAARQAGAGMAARLRLGAFECAEAEGLVARLGGMASSPVVREADFVFHRLDGRLRTVVSGQLIGIRPRAGAPVLPVLDQLDGVATDEFSRSGGDPHPLLLSRDLIPGAKAGDIYELESGGRTRRFRVVALLRQDGIFSFPLLVVPLAVAMDLTGRGDADYVAARSLSGGSAGKSEELAEASDAEMDGKYLVQHWTESFRAITSLFRSINFVISAIVSSLFLIAFFFAIALFDIVLRRRRKNIAILLALGLRPGAIRNAVALFGSLLGLCGFACGLGACLAFLAALPRLPLAEKLAAVFITDFSFAFSWPTAATALFLALATAVLSAWFSGRRVFRIDPIEDIRA